MIPRGPTVGLVAVAALLGVLSAGVGLGAAAWAVGVASGLGVCGLLARGLLSRSRRLLGPADHITLFRAVLTCGVAALATDAAVTGGSASAAPDILVGICVVALVLDAVDGHVARRTRTVTLLGARFDMEVDAFLILVLSVHVARDLGWWVAAVGAARYALLVAQRCAAWLRAGVPPRRWRKAVAAYQGVGLTVVAAGVLPPVVEVVVVGAGLLALGLSFGTEARALWRVRADVAPRASRDSRRDKPGREASEHSVAGSVAT